MDTNYILDIYQKQMYLYIVKTIKKKKNLIYEV